MTSYFIIAGAALCSLAADLCSAQPPKPASIAVPAISLQCPAYMKITDRPEAPAGWDSHVGQRQVALKGGGIIEQRDHMEGDLAPSTEDRNGTTVQQEWRLALYRDGILLLRCEYRDTQASLTLRIPDTVERCNITFRADKTGQSVDVPRISCR